MTEFTVVLIFLIATLSGLILSFFIGKKSGEKEMENKHNKAFIVKALETRKRKNELNKKNNNSLIANYIKLLNKTKFR
jgi:uncharacterized membrane protein YdjX (TVP38/TMEM64 family)